MSANRFAVAHPSMMDIADQLGVAVHTSDSGERFVVICMMHKGRQLWTPMREDDVRKFVVQMMEAADELAGISHE